jgi:hypothetical protein
MTLEYKIPTWDDELKEWSYTLFSSKREFRDFLLPLFKEPGKYNFDKTSLEFNKQAQHYNTYGVFSFSPEGTKDHKDYWDTEKEKCRSGVIYKNKKNTWYLTRDYYMWLNFLPLYNKEISLFGFPDIRDAQYHMALYEFLGSLQNKHAAILKKRQIASSYFHVGKIINLFWFEEGAVCKMAASLKDYINEKGSWRFLEEYRNFLNQHTAWYRPCNPDKMFNWEQKIEVDKGGRKKDVGLKSVISGYALDKDPSNGVGGPCTFFFHEEGGIAPKADDTLEYLLPALKSGMDYTGFYAIAGSVGDLDQCEPLKELILNPDSKDVYAVQTNLLDDEGSIAMCGLFIPEQWSMQPCIDKYGNSEVEKALDMILAEREIWKKKLKASQYQLRISQKPINIKEAFDYRTESVFPLHLVTKQIRRIEDKMYFTEYVDLERTEENKIEIKKSRKRPILEFPISPKTEDKTGVVVMHERPLPNPTFGMYYASIDPVAAGKTTSTVSLCSIIIYKTAQEVIRHKENGQIEQHIERDGIVATWCGRFDDLNKTHERLSMLIEVYNAWAICENNVSAFIQYMIAKRRQKYLVPKNQIAFLREIKSNANVFQEYGWRNVGTIFKNNMIPYGVQFLEEEIDRETDEDGTVKKVTFGVERIPDIMILKEMLAYRDGVNVDRLISFCALAAFAAVQQSNRGYTKRIEKEDNLDNTHKKTNLFMSPFTHIGNQKKKSTVKGNHRRAFKNIGR